MKKYVSLLVTYLFIATIAIGQARAEKEVDENIDPLRKAICPQAGTKMIRKPD
jgi:hypothetical protein